MKGRTLIPGLAVAAGPSWLWALFPGLAQAAAWMARSALIEVSGKGGNKSPPPPCIMPILLCLSLSYASQSKYLSIVPIERKV